MEERTRIIARCLEILGSDYHFWYDGDIVSCERVNELQYQNISFKFSPNKLSSLNLIKQSFNSKIEDLRSEFKQHDINGGRYQYDGYIIFVKLNTANDIRSSIALATREYDDKLRLLYSQLEFFEDKAV